MKFKPSGLRILENINGNILICDSARNVDLIITAEALNKAELSESSAHALLIKILRLLKTQRERRWIQAKKDLIDIANENISFVKLRKKYIKNETFSNLKKLEKDIYFYKLERDQTITKTTFN